MYSAAWIGAALLAIKGKLLPFVALTSLLPIIRSDALPLALLNLVVWDRAFSANNSVSRRLLFYAISLLPSAGYIIFRIVYFQDTVPNTAYVKFLERESLQRLSEGAIYVGNYLMYWKWVAVLPILAWSQRSKLDFNSIRLLFQISVLFAGQLLWIVFIGGDVSWKPFFRFCFVPELFAIVSLIIITNEMKAVRRSSLFLVVLMIRLLIVPTGTTSTAFGYNDKLFSDFSLNGLTSLRLYPQDSPRRWRDLFTPRDDVLVVSGKLIRQCSDRQDVLLKTTAAGKLVYHSETRTEDLSGLASRRSKTTTSNDNEALNQRRQSIVALEYHFGRPWIFDRSSVVDYHPLVAVVYSARMNSGMPVLIFSNDLTCWKSRIASAPSFRGRMQQIHNKRFMLYTDSPAAHELFLEYAAETDYFGF